MIRAQTFRFAKYRLGKKIKMITIKCRCVTCDTLVEKFIEDKCIRCYHDTIIQPVAIKYDRMLLQESAFNLSEVTRLREVDLENNRFWSSCVESYRNRLEVRMVDRAKHYVWYVTHLFWSFVGFVRLLSIGGVAGFRNILPWQQKKQLH